MQLVFGAGSNRQGQLGVPRGAVAISRVPIPIRFSRADVQRADGGVDWPTVPSPVSSRPQLLNPLAQPFMPSSVPSQKTMCIACRGSQLGMTSEGPENEPLTGRRRKLRQRRAEATEGTDNGPDVLNADTESLSQTSEDSESGTEDEGESVDSVKAKCLSPDGVCCLEVERLRAEDNHLGFGPPGTSPLRLNLSREDSMESFTHFAQQQAVEAAGGNPDPQDVILAATGNGFTVFCSSQKETYACGAARHGRLGLGEPSDATSRADEPGSEGMPSAQKLAEHFENTFIDVPARLAALSGFQIVSLACGDSHTLLATSEGQVFSFGCNKFGQLGLGEEEERPMASEPQVVLSMQSRPVTRVACGAHHSLLVTKSGELFSCGWNLSGQVGIGTVSEEPCRSFFSVSIPGYAGKVVGAAAGHSHSVCVTKHGCAFQWGGSDFWWQHRDEDDDGWIQEEESGKLRPTLIQLLEPAQSVACGHDHTVVVSRIGTVYTFGTASRGRLGIYAKTDRVQAPRALNLDQIVGDETVASVSCGYAWSAAILKPSRDVLLWGDNAYGQLTVGVMPTCYKPTRFDHPNRINELLLMSSGCCAEHQITVYSRRLNREASVAFLMGTHHRLGALSPLLLLDPCIAAYIARI